MRNRVPIVLLTLVALSLPISAAGPAASVAAQDGTDGSTAVESSFISTYGNHAQLDGTPNRLVLKDDRRTTHTTPMFDFGLTLANHDESIRIDHQAFALESRIATLENDEDRRNAIETDLERIEERIDNLRDREQEVVANHAASEASEAAVLRMIAKNSYEARQLQQALEGLDEQSSGIVDVSDSVNDLTAELEVYTGPVRTEIESSLRGTDELDETADSSPAVAIESAPNGLVLSMLDGTEYLHEATRYDNRALDQTEQIETMDDARNLGEELYPWAFETTSGTSTSKYSSVGLYQVQASSHEQGQLTVYLDSGSSDVYHERQTLDVERIPIETTDTIGSGSVNATLERTPGATPARITVTDADGTPVSATVAVNETTVGETDENGELWFASSTGEYELTIQTESETLTATVASSR